MDVTTTQAAQILGVTNRTIQKYIKAGLITARKRGIRNLVIDLEELRTFAETNSMVFDAELAHQLAHQ